MQTISTLTFEMFLPLQQTFRQQLRCITFIPLLKIIELSLTLTSNYYLVLEVLSDEYFTKMLNYLSH